MRLRVSNQICVFGLREKTGLTVENLRMHTENLQPSHCKATTLTATALAVCSSFQIYAVSISCFRIFPKRDEHPTVGLIINNLLCVFSSSLLNFLTILWVVVALLCFNKALLAPSPRLWQHSDNRKSVRKSNSEQTLLKVNISAAARFFYFIFNIVVALPPCCTPRSWTLSAPRTKVFVPFTLVFV